MDTESSLSPGQVLTKPLSFVGHTLASAIRLLSRLLGRCSPFLSFVVLPLLLVGALMGGYLSTTREVTMVIDDRFLQVRTHQGSVRGLLKEKGIEIRGEDIVLPDLDTPLRRVDSITVRRARSVSFVLDGERLELRTQSQTVGELLGEAGVELGHRDRALVEGVEASLGTSLPSVGTFPPGEEMAPLEVTVQRAKPTYIDDDGAQVAIYTFAPTVGRVLYEEGITLYLGDRISPPLDSPVSWGARVSIRRSKPVTILADGRIFKTRTHTEKVSEVLEEQGITLTGKDYSVPQGAAPVRDGLSIRVVRRVEETFVEKDPIRFQELIRPDPELEIDHMRLVQGGSTGVRNRQYRTIYEDGEEVERRLEREWVEPQPVNEITAYGTKIVVRTADTPEGPIRYWRKMRVLITSYNEFTCDKEPGHPAFGITFMGWQVSKGIIAVDPKVIKLESKAYVPGYGLAVAGDTGGKIRGRHVDLYFPERAMELWYKWDDIYLLEPVPPRDQIRWILP